MPKPSTLRVLVDTALANQNTTLETFLEVGQANGKSIRTLADELNGVTGIPIAWRTLYRWAESIDKVAS